jgi:hypothetical protein
MADLRRLVSTVVVASFSVAALLGIYALLKGGDFGETEGNVLLTTVVVGLESIALLCYLASLGKPFAAVGYAGAPVSLLAAGIALYLTWAGDGEGDWVDLLKAFGVLVTLAASLAQASLLLALTARRRMTAVLVGTLAAVGVVALMVVVAILGEDVDDGFWRLLGVVAILDVLGTVVLAATSAFGRNRTEEPGPGLLSEGVRSRVAAAARERGVTPDELVTDALDALLP